MIIVCVYFYSRLSIPCVYLWFKDCLLLFALSAGLCGWIALFRLILNRQGREGRQGNQMKRRLRISGQKGKLIGLCRAYPLKKVGQTFLSVICLGEQERPDIVKPEQAGEDGYAESGRSMTEAQTGMSVSPSPSISPRY